MLIVDDDAPFAELIRETLKPRPVRFAQSFSEAIRMINELPPEVVLLDLSLPDSTPAQTIARIKEIKAASKDVTVIVVTGSPEVYRLHNEALCQGADYIISKDNGFFDALAVALLNVGKKPRCASEPTVERIEQAVGRMVSHPPFR